MLTIGKLKSLIEGLPDTAGIIAYDGESCGLRVVLGDYYGWIETGYYEDIECDSNGHSLIDIENME